MARKTVTFTKVSGLNRALRRLPDAIRAEVEEELWEVAQDSAAEARRRADRLGGVAGLVEPSIKPVRGRNPQVRMGSRTRLPAAGSGWRHRRSGRKARGQGSLDASNQTIGALIFGAEFGGGTRERTAAGGSTRQFPPHTGNEGRFLWPSVRDNLDRIVEAVADRIPQGIDRAAR